MSSLIASEFSEVGDVVGGYGVDGVGGDEAYFDFSWVEAVGEAV